MANYEEAIAKLNKLKSAAKSKTRTTLRIIKKNFQDELPHELFVTTRQKTKTKNPFANIWETVKFARLTEIIQSDAFPSNMKGKLGKEALTKFAVPSAKDVPPQLEAKATLFNKQFWKKNCAEVVP